MIKANAVVPAGWTRWYWPAALTVSVAALIALPHFTGPVTAGGAVLLGGPELWFVLRREWASTLSDWFWRVLHVTRQQPVSEWSAVHFLAWCLYLAVALRIMWWAGHHGYWTAAGTLGMACWLNWHLFRGWWR